MQFSKKVIRSLGANKQTTLLGMLTACKGLNLEHEEKQQSTQLLRVSQKLL
jgi:hypothetical protein